MSRDLKRISVVAIFFLVLVRISIGWQFLYEGLWKHRSQSTANPWSAEGYLSNAQGPLRPVFQSIVGDPYGLEWLDEEKVNARWEAWREEFTQFYALTDEQKQQLAAFMSGYDEYSAPLEKLPAEVNFDGSLGPRIMFRQNEETPGELVIIKGQTLESPHFRKLRTAYVSKAAAPEYHAALDELERRVAAKGYTKELRDLFSRAPEWSGAVTGTIDGKEQVLLEQWTGKIEAYKQMVADYEQNLATARQDFQFTHLKKDWSELQEYKAELIPPVKAMDSELRTSAVSLLTEEQKAKGALPKQPEKIDQINQLTIWCLIVLGVLLMVGFFSRVAALAGAGMLISFYLVSPPLPGLPPSPGPEHELFINKNMIEAFALMALVFVPSGTWFGVDAIFRAIFGGKRKADKPPAA